ncbi:MAG TPA: hypothetical protein VG106_05470 [Vicinamibacterales bacterium]|nr:hypothetical protein [Vicinamibacterales bacterium]
MRAPAALVLLFTISCASSPPPLVAPEWNAIPLGVVDALCLRLKAEGLASGARVTVVNTTQPIATARTIAALSGPAPRKVSGEQVTTALRGAQKTIPLTLGGGACAWRAIDAAAIGKHVDEMVVEMSAPLANPFHPGAAGVFVRVSLGGEHASWYWVSLIPQQGGWSVGFIQALSL